jgi:serine/threonine-protein kinase
VDAREMGMYELDSRIAQGGMGEVWRAKHRLLSRPAAVKLIRPRDNGSSSRSQAHVVAERRFEREAQVTASLKSPHTVELYDFGVTDSGTIYYVMELLEGSDLEELVRRDGPLPPKRVVQILKQALDSLAEAHDHGLIHRDIKPANLHVSQRGLEADFVKVLDFGLVKDSGRKKVENSITGVNGIVGTPAYLAPELITGDGQVDGRADLYSLGAVAYFLLTGRLVFDAQTPMLMAVAHVTSAPLPPSQRTEQAISPALDRLVLSCLAKRPEDRPGNARTLLRMLEELDLSEEAVRPRSAFALSASRPDNSLN